MKLSEFCAATGATARQVDLLVTYDMDLFSNDVQGQGNHRNYREEAVPVVRLLVDFQKKMGGNIPHSILKLIYDNYQEECVRVGRVWLTWRANRADQTYASSRGGASSIR